MEYDFDTKQALILGSLKLLKEHKRVDDDFTLNVFPRNRYVKVFAYAQKFESNPDRMHARMRE